MSSYVVGNEHIDMLLTAAEMYPRGPLAWAHDGERRFLSPDTRDRVGAMLLGTNQDSVNARYNETDPAPEYRWKVSKVPPSPVEVLKGIHCLEYQSSDLPGWEATEAHAFLASLTSTMIRKLPGYDDAPWEWTVEAVSR